MARKRKESGERRRGFFFFGGGAVCSSRLWAGYPQRACRGGGRGVVGVVASGASFVMRWGHVAFRLDHHLGAARFQRFGLSASGCAGPDGEQDASRKDASRKAWVWQNFCASLVSWHRRRRRICAILVSWHRRRRRICASLASWHQRRRRICASLASWHQRRRRIFAGLASWHQRHRRICAGLASWRQRRRRICARLASWHQRRRRICACLRPCARPEEGMSRMQFAGGL